MKSSSICSNWRSSASSISMPLCWRLKPILHLGILAGMTKILTDLVMVEGVPQKLAPSFPLPQELLKEAAQ